MLLVTGGAGYIGSHTVLELLQNDAQVLVLDNLSNASPTALERVSALCGRRAQLVVGDICDRTQLDQLFATYPISAVIHFAGLKAVGESAAQPLRYYQNNVQGTITLCQAMAAAGVKQLVFSSSATVYGDPQSLPITESAPTSATNPYGRSKLMIEEILRDVVVADPQWRIALLRYFNPVGAHHSGQIGEDPNGIPNNLLPYIAQVAIGRLPYLQIFGDDYQTLDGTGVRDYIHVVDLAQGHLAALDYLQQHSGVHTFNLGTGCGYSVLQMRNAFADACGRDIAYRIAPRRAGDIAACYADPSHAAQSLNWRAQRGLVEMMQDTWRWQSGNPNGYREGS